MLYHQRRLLWLVIEAGGVSVSQPELSLEASNGPLLIVTSKTLGAETVATIKALQSLKKEVEVTRLKKITSSKLASTK